MLHRHLQIATSSSYFNNTKRARCCVCAQGISRFSRNPLPVLWIKCHLAAHKVTSVRKQRVIKQNRTHNALPGIRLCCTADKSGCTFHRVCGAAPRSSARNADKSAGQRDVLAHYEVHGIFLSPSFLLSPFWDSFRPLLTCLGCIFPEVVK